MTRRGSPVRLLLAGFGNVGRALAGILAGRAKYPGLAGLDVGVVGITTGSHGALASSEGIDLASALEEFSRHGRFTTGHPGATVLDTTSAVATLDYDVLVELSPLSVAGRGEPAISHVRGALERGRHVVTANKGPVAWAYRELTGLAADRGCRLLYETTVMDGVPVFNLARHGLRGDVVRRIEGVLNSTTNVVLGELERGASMADAVAAAKAAGVAEADPSADLDGWDGAVKLSVLANAVMGFDLRPESVVRESVGGMEEGLPRRARRRGARVKQVCELERNGDAVRGAVRLRELSAGDTFGRLDGADSAIRFVTDILGTIVVTEERPSLATTAFGVISDLLALGLPDAG
ncbi:MAG TPA: hypothetical protein VMT19_08845 [Thermoanaerobaculaceae bacterium]|nr:hypothetical protein [Thermoanaerobaculaceae bacterium]